MLTHLYKIIGRMTPAQYAKFDYLMNFGVSITSKVTLQKAVENAGNYKEFKDYLDEIPFKEVLMIHKYYTFAQKKLKVIMYSEQIDQVSEDLLKEVNDKDEDLPSAPPASKKKKGGPSNVVKANKRIDRLKHGKIL